LVYPNLLPNFLVQKLQPDPSEEADKYVDCSIWSTVGRPEPEEKITMEIFGHMDGVQIFKSSAVSSVKPILSKISAIRNSSGSVRVQLPSKMPVFLVGIYHGAGCSMEDLVKDYFDELDAMKPGKDPSQPFYVELVCMICDAPQRSDCKFTPRWNGYKSCERCIQDGERVDKEGSKTKVMIYPLMNQPLRKDKDWIRMARHESILDPLVSILQIVRFF